MYEFKVSDPSFLPHCGCEVEIIFDKGKLVSLQGPNGIGKTTLLGRLAGFSGPSLAIVEQKNPDIFFDRSLKKFKELFLLAGGNEINRPRLEKLWSDFRLSLKEERMLTSLSGGERQMLKISLGLSLDRELYLLDEPSQNLDRRSKNILEGVLKDLLNENRSILMVEHDLGWTSIPAEILHLDLRDNILRMVTDG